MNTKGIINSRQIDGNRILADFGTQTYYELALKGMLISCFTYSSIDKGSYDFDKYIAPYKEKLSESVFNEVYEEMKNHFKNCKVDTSVYTDGDGCTYNNLIEGNV